MAPVLEVPLLPLPPPFMLVPVSVPVELGLVLLPAGVLVAPPESAGPATVPALLASDSVPEALVLFSLLPQLLSDRPPSSTAAKGRKEMECRMEIKEKG